MKDFAQKKTTIVAILFTTFLFFAFLGSHPTSNSGGYTGAPNDSACTQCHSPGGNLDGTIEISGLPSTVTANQTYSLTVTITDISPSMNAAKAGFQMVSLKQNLANGGTFSSTTGETNTQVKTANGKSYIGHQPAKDFPANDIITYNVDWTAPSSADGNITLYGASMVVNGSNSNSGDKFIATSITTQLEGSGTPLSVSFSNQVIASCFDSNDGIITANATGGTGNYTYTWDNGETGATATMLSGGLHSITVSDGNNDIVEQTFVEFPDDIIVSLVSQSDATCANTNTGTAEVSAIQGNGNFTYDWGNGLIGAVQNNLSAGIYNVTATDIKGCQNTLEVIIQEPQFIIINITTLSQPSCSGDSDGIITVEATGGAGGFTYNWLTGGIGSPNGATITDLPSGTYLVEVFDMNNCSNEIDITLGEPDAIDLNITTSNVSCYQGEDGSAIVSATGGTGPYTFSWSNSGTGTTQTNYSAGTHFVTATDFNNCMLTIEFNIAEPASSVTASINVDIQPNCGNADGSISAFANGGTPNYTYLWEDGSTNSILTNIPSGIYTVSITDNNGCLAITEHVLTDNEGITLAANNVLNNTCNGDSSGSATISANGGQGDYTYEWSNGGTNATESNLAAGFYTISVTDIGGCFGDITIEITEPDEFLPNENIINIDCFNAENGSISLAPSGGTGSITYLWNIGSTEDTIQNLLPALYSVVLTDEANCTEEFEFIIEEPDEIIFTSINTQHPFCPGDSTGFISLEANGGTGSISYSWSNEQDTSTIENLEEGDYTVSATDENNCISTQAFTLEDPLEVSVDFSSSIPTCPESTDGEIILIASGGTPDYTYLWNDGSTNDTLANIEAGEYMLTVTDMNGCVITTNITLDGPQSINANITTTNVTVSGANDGTATANPENGSAPYSLLWSNGANTNTINSLSPGTYSVSITDALGCPVDTTFIINNGDCNLEAVAIIENISCNGETDGSITITLSGAEEPLSYEWNTGDSTNEINDLSAGLYSVTATDAFGCLIQLVDIEIKEPDSISASTAVIIDATNSNSEDGSISIEFSGGTGPLNLQITDNEGQLINSNNLDNLAQGSYGIIITDENGCKKTFGPYEVGVITSTIDLTLEASIFPTPAQNFVKVILNKKTVETPQLYNYNGQRIFAPIIQLDLSYEIDVTALTNGVYYLKLTSNQGTKVKRLLIAK